VREADNLTIFMCRVEIWKPKPPGTLWATPGLLRDSFTLQAYKYIFNYPANGWLQ